MTTLLNRRSWLSAAGLLLAAGCRRPKPAPDDVAEQLLRFPGKVPLRVINDRPPCLETPWRFFRHDLTPNEAFYVRWHLQVIPTRVDLAKWRLRIGADGPLKPLELSLGDIKRFPKHSVVAVNQCSGNSRGLFDPPIPGAQWRNGAMGNARWTGVLLRDVLRKANLPPKGIEASFQGMDRGGPPGVPDYIKTLPLERCLDAKNEILLAYEMNGEPLPLLNGFPLRLVVPGWYATYWIKSLESITVRSAPAPGFWMNPAYRIPDTADGCEPPGKLATKTIPIHRMNVRSFFTTPDAKSKVRVNEPVELDGIAFDGGNGIKRVEVSSDGKTWERAMLGKDLGQYSFRRWSLTWTPDAKGTVTLKVRATTNSGETQPDKAGWNRAGYMRNVIETLTLEVV